MKDKLTISGKIVSGNGKAAFFTQLNWVQQQCQEKLGFKPFPGTLNLAVDEKKALQINALCQEYGQTLEPLAKDFCAGHVYSVSIMGVTGAIVSPSDDVRVNADHIIELIAPISLKEALDADVGDEILIVITLPH